MTTNAKTLFTYKATVLKVVDGDTLDLRVDLGFHVSTTIRARVLGVDTPEINRSETNAAGKAAKDFVGQWCGFSACEVVIQTEKDPGDKYGRWLARVTNAKGEDLTEALVAAGHGKRYDGGAKA